MFSYENLKERNIKEIISAFEVDDMADLIYRNITDEDKVKNKIFNDNGKYYYLPIENNEIRMCKSLTDVGGSYQLFSQYTDKMLNDLKNTNKKTEEMYGSEL